MSKLSLKRLGQGDQEIAVVFDIGSASVGGAFVILKKNADPEVIYSTREEIPFQEHVNFSRFLTLMIETLGRVFDKVEKAGGGTSVKNAYCILSSPWYASQTRIIRYSKDKPFEVTAKLMDGLINKEVDMFRHSKLFEHSKIKEALPEIMELKNIQTKLNGYETTKPLGKKVRDMEIALYISLIPPTILDSIEDSIKKFWNVNKVSLASFSFTAFDAIRDIFSNESTFLFLDISGEITDISIIKDGNLLESITFPLGRNYLMRTLTSELKTVPKEALDKYKLYNDGALNDAEMLKVERIIEKARGQWVSSFESSLAQFSDEHPIPRMIFYACDDDVAEWFKDSMNSAKFTKFALEEGEFSIKLLGSTFLDKFCRILEPSYRDPFLSVESLAANKLFSLEK